MAAITRLTRKHQTTIPQEVRKVLGLRAGDFVEFRIRGKNVAVRKASRQISEETLFKLAQTRSMADWDTPEDDEAFRDL